MCTEDWSNDAEQINTNFKYIKIEIAEFLSK